MGKVLGIVNRKGGVGKTTTATTLSYLLSKEGCKVALIDFDGQRHTTKLCGVTAPEQLSVTIYDILKCIVMNEELPDKGSYMIRTETGVDLIPANNKLDNFDKLMCDTDFAEYKLKELENLAEKIPQYLKDEERKLGELKEQFEAAKVQAERPFSEEEKLSEFLKEQVSLNLELEFADADEEGMEKAGKSHGNSIYRKLRKLAPELFEGTYTYMKFKQDGFDDLVLETIGENEYSIAHYYTQNGDRMRDPEITFMLDDTQRCIYALSYTQDNMGIYYETGDRTEKQMEDLMGFFDQWMANIKEQGFTLYKAYGEDAEYTKEEEHTEEMGYTVISADNLKQMNRFDGEDMENER